MAARKTVNRTRKKREFLGLLLIVLGVLVLLSLLSYHPDDWPNSSQRFPVNNWMGLVGAWIAYHLFIYTIGYPVLVLPFLIMYWGWAFLRSAAIVSVLRRTGYVLFFALCFSVAFALPRTFQSANLLNHEFNGHVGLFIAQLLYRYLGSIGSVLVLFTVVLVVFLSLTEVSLASLAAAAGEQAKDLWRRIQRNWEAWMHRRKLQKALRKKEREAVSGSQTVLEEERQEERRRESGGEEVPVVEAEEVATEVTWFSQPPAESAPAIEAPRQAIAEEPESRGNGNVSSVPERQERLTVDTVPADYRLPPLEILKVPPPEDREQKRHQLLEEARLLEEKLAVYGIEARVVGIHPGPLVTQFEVEPGQGVKISKFFAIADDLAMVMRAPQIRILAPIPGKSAVGIEIPNREPAMIYFRQVIDTDAYRSTTYRLPIALGVDTTGKTYIADLVRMPHLLVAGSTGSGKSVCLNTIIASLLYRFSPEDVRLILIDPKKLELSVYAELRNHHLITLPELDEEVITTPQNAIAILERVWMEMERRFSILAHAGVRTLEEYNDRLQSGELQQLHPDKQFEKIPYLIVIIDELADLMLVAGNEIEDPIGRLAHKARAVGIHLIVATQRPSTDVITGAIKANFPSRIAFKVFSKTDSRVVLDLNGAERLLGRGDMLFLPPGQPQPIRLHGPFISTEEVQEVIRFVAQQPPFPAYELPHAREETLVVDSPDGPRVIQRRDPLFDDALRLVVSHNQASVSLLQRKLRIGYARAARLIDELEEAGFIGEYDGVKGREVFVTIEDLEKMGIYNRSGVA